MSYDFTQLLEDSTSYTKLSRLKTHPDYDKLVERTSFLTNPTITQRWWHAANDTWCVPTCKLCQNPVTWRKESKSYNVYCSAKCAQNDPELKRRKEATNIDRYGATTYLRSDKGINDTQQVLKSKGVTNFSQLECVKEKVRNTMVNKYGGYAMQSPELRKRIDDTNIQRYGAARPSTSATVKQKIRNAYASRFGCHPQQRHISKDALEKLNNAEWLTNAHHIDEKSLSAIALELGVADSTTIKLRLEMFGIEHRFFQHSIGEMQVVEYITSLGVELHRNVRHIIAPRELDIYIPSHNLAIEYCGLYWHSDRLKSPLYHFEKYKACCDAGITLLTIFEDEWVGRQEIVKQKIDHLLRMSGGRRVAARKCSIGTIPAMAAREFMDRHHIQGPARVGKLHLGMEYDGDLVAVLTASTSGSRITIQRYATSCIVQGGFTRLLEELKRQRPNWQEIITFADNRWSAGDLYRFNGFTLDGILPPDYSYSPDGHRRIHKFNYRRVNLPKLLSHFDPNLTEMANCDANGVLRIWDCGKHRYIIKRTPA